MTFDEYSVLAEVTAPDVLWRDEVDNALFGLGGEVW
jgi:hypothetical protein